MYVDDQELAQFQHDHKYETYLWQMEQFQQDLSELQTLNVNVDPLGFGSPEEVEEEEDPEEDPEEEEHSKRFDSFESFRSFGDFDEPDYLRDLEDFEPQEY